MVNGAMCREEEKEMCKGGPKTLCRRYPTSRIKMEKGPLFILEGFLVIYLLPSLPSLLPSPLPTPNNPDSNVVYRHTARAGRPLNKPGLSAPELCEPSMELKLCDAVNSFARARVS